MGRPQRVQADCVQEGTTGDTMRLYRPYEQQKLVTTTPRRVFMRKLVLSLTVASAIVTATSVIAPAQAMTAGTASAIETAIDNLSAVEDAAYVCRHRYYSSRRACFWRPGYRYRGYRHRRYW